MTFPPWESVQISDVEMFRPLQQPLSSTTMAAQIQKLEQQLTASPADPNPLLPLLALARHPSPEVVHKACWALYRVFGTQLSQNRVGGITGRGDESTASLADGAREAKAWVRERLLEYVSILGGLLRDSESALRVR